MLRTVAIITLFILNFTIPIVIAAIAPLVFTHLVPENAESRNEKMTSRDQNHATCTENYTSYVTNALNATNNQPFEDEIERLPSILFYDYLK